MDDEGAVEKSVKATVENDELVFCLEPTGEEKVSASAGVDENGNLIKKRKPRKNSKKRQLQASKKAKPADWVPKKRGRKPKLDKKVQPVQISKRMMLTTVNKLLARDEGLDDGAKIFLEERKRCLEAKKAMLAARVARVAARKAKSVERERKKALIEEKRMFRVENGLPARGRIRSKVKKLTVPKPRYGRFGGRGPLIFDHG